LRRVARYADGWLPGGTPEQFQAGLGKVKEMQRKYGREGVELEVGPESFICVAETTEKAWQIADATVKKFGGLTEISRVRGASPFVQQNFVGSVADVSKRLAQYREAGANYAEFKFISNTLDEMLNQMSLIATEIIPQFSQ
jgi:alkanesulfonate monooxygenase SsuD/methylene tetrahydromethanopterin reductase-like flavin-dependent oxidoreductase (luciferase family)